MVKLRIFHDKEKGLRRAFSLYLKPDENGVASLGLKKMIIYIEEHGRRTGVTFPLKPRVASLRDYDDLRTARKQPIQGYPLICVTVSHHFSFEYGKMGNSALGCVHPITFSSIPALNQSSRHCHRIPPY